jgi:UDP-glucose:tetrahydrobiopterin glucosyltransferase
VRYWSLVFSSRISPVSNSLNLLLVSTPVGPLGSGLGGGVELTLRNIAVALLKKGHRVTVLAPEGSTLEGIPLIAIPGNLQTTAQTEGRDDLILNFAYDWLPFYLTAFFTTPLAHLVSMGSLTDATDRILSHVASSFPHALAVHSLAQAETFAWADRAENVKNGFDLSQYEFCPTAGDYVAWVGRISPEKGLQDAIAAAIAAQVRLKIFGVIQDTDYWERLLAQNQGAAIEYCGFLSTQELQQALGQAQALLMTPHWVEAFGNVAIEAMACGVPVIAYQRGGPAEIVNHGVTGWLVEPDSVPALSNALRNLGQIDRAACRLHAETEYSLEAMGIRLNQWFDKYLAGKAPQPPSLGGPSRNVSPFYPVQSPPELGDLGGRVT